MFEYNDAENEYYKENWETNFSNIMSWDEWKWCWAVLGIEFQFFNSKHIMKI